MSGCLRTLLGRVPDGYRAALELTDLGGLTQAAADQLGLSTSGMKSVRPDERVCLPVASPG